ncbi:MAG TPA: prolyl oligopeptidase family serine peptidase [Thermomicrobiaceae bacterium]|nr:prolyl oligopeptidase family serine peptidase [Thermomicrobiaceae bacterium]
MSEQRTAPYGSWASPIMSSLIASSTISLSLVQVAGSDVYWIESRPLDGGRYVVVRHTADGRTEDVTPPGFNARDRVHEYGGGSYWVHGQTVFFTNFVDQRLYRQDPGAPPRPITPEPATPAGLRHADGTMTPDGRLIVCVQEEHRPDGEVVNRLVALPADGSAPPVPIAAGRDFYADPEISPDGQRLAWICWGHPRMPWDGSELWVADLAADGRLSGATMVAGGPEVSIFQPSWSPDGTLHFASDRTGFWNLYALREGRTEALAPMEAEFGEPLWQLAASTYGFLSKGRIVCSYGRQGIDYLGVIEPGSGRVTPLDTRFTAVGSLAAGPGGDRVCFIGGSATEHASVVALHVASDQVDVLRRSFDGTVDPGYLSTPRPIEFPTEGGLTAHALYYAPRNRDFRGTADERPPLLVFSHGGPTGQTTSRLSLSIQYWTSRGFAVVDVNYGGSSGYGRAYRERLKGNWGVVDVDDCVNAARYLTEQGEVDGNRLTIRGGSAGGYTTLAALAFRDVFKAGASYYGVADAGALARDTHKFESRYLDGLIGPYPQDEAVYRQRSALFHAGGISCPIILFQGLEDKVVPPQQAEAMIAALNDRGVPYAYLPFAGEQHGFRRAENIARSLDAELYFYSRFFGFEPADRIEPVEIHHA